MLPQRALGSLTGSRTAGALGRVPVQSRLKQVEGRCQLFVLDVGAVRGWCGGAYVDNVYTMSHSLGGAIQLAEATAKGLADDWELQIKTKSRAVLTVEGSIESEHIDQLLQQWPEWQHCRRFGCLGHRIAADCSCGPDVEACLKGIWGALVRNFSRRARESFALQAKHRMMLRVALPLFDFRCARWVPSVALGRRLDAFQRRCIMLVDGERRRSGEEPKSWYARRSRRAGVQARAMGLWSERQLQKATAWHDHLLREAARSEGPRRPASAALRHRDAAWRRAQRVAAGSQSSEAGRLGRRRVTHVRTRWEDGVRGLARARR